VGRQEIHSEKINWVSIAEFLLALYCLAGVILSVIDLEIAAVPFQLLFLTGFGSISYLSIKQAILARRHATKRVPQPGVVAEEIVK